MAASLTWSRTVKNESLSYQNQNIDTIGMNIEIIRIVTKLVEKKLGGKTC